MTSSLESVEVQRAPSEARPLVLVVDDDFDIRDTLADILSDAGYRIASAADGLEALDYLRANPPPQVILLDWMMPRCDGAAFRAVQLSEPALAGIPVVLLTADAHADPKGFFGEMGEFLRKPVQLADLLHVIEQHCSRR